ncbi:MAG: efflux transporter periplasmic adaptor subunit [Proteobacteria bacterium]|nr:MAG: efflux transporter periplasmic adaptor subunit [Pseudomonadota bacterium]
MSIKSTLKTLTTVTVLALIGGGGWYAWQLLQSDKIPERLKPYENVIKEVKSHIRTPEKLPEGVSVGNGRIEATEYDIATKLPGRLVKVLAKEGDMVRAGQVLAQMDTDDLKGQLREATAALREAKESRKYALAVVDQKQSALIFAQAELKRFTLLARRGHISQEKVDQQRMNNSSARAAVKAANIQVVRADAKIDAARATLARVQNSIDDSTLKTPIAGRVLYRLSEPGEVLPSGGKVFTVLDLTDVYMSIYLPTAEAGKVTVGDPARIVLDALPQYVIPAEVSFVSSEAQFTPKTVETRDERDKLMFRVKVRIDPKLLKSHIKQVKTGVPGLAYVLLSPNKHWPEKLQVRVPE